MRRAAAGLLLAAVAGTACSRREKDVFPQAPVVLISVDTLRADHLPAYGYRLVQTPALDALRRDSVLFENAISHVPLTLPSHVTILTGLLPPQNGMRDNIGFSLSPAPQTLPSLLKKNGYATGAAVSAIVLSGSSGVSRGFDEYDDSIEANVPGLTAGDIQRSGFSTEKIAESWIHDHENGPFFYFLHLYEPHTPYEPAAPFDAIYKDRPYDGEIATADRIIGAFVAFLRREGLYDRAVVIFLSDHGEGLGEHGEDEHGMLLYRETLHVPLFVKLPGAKLAGTSVSRTVALVDVFPTVARLLGIAPPPGLDGRPLLGEAASASARSVYSETLYPRFHYGWSDLSALTDERFEYIHAPSDELYDYRSDPQELRNLAPSLPPPFRSMRNALLAMARPLQMPGTVDAEQVKKLASLGYLGSTMAPAGAKDLPNPMDHIADVKSLKEAHQLAAGRAYEEALPHLLDLLRRDPEMTDGWAELATVLRRLGRDKEALAALAEVDRRSPNSALVFNSYANIYIDLGDLPRAETYARRAVAASDSSAMHANLAHVLLLRGNLAEAELEARRALTAHAALEQPRLVLALVAEERGDLSGALGTLDALRAEAMTAGRPPMSSVNLHRGQILARLGRLTEAQQAVQEEIAGNSGALAAWRLLATLQADQGNLAEAKHTLEEMVHTTPNARSAAAATETWKLLTARASGGRR